MKDINILKLLSFVFIFLLIVFLIIFILIVPDIKRLKFSKIKYQQVNTVFQHTNSNLNSKIKELKELKHDNLKTIRAFDNGFKKDEFLKFSKKYFSYAKLTETNNTIYKKDFKEYSFNTLSKMTDPTVFYRFLTDINRYDNIIQVDFPISMKAVGDDINTTFKLKVYTLKKDKFDRDKN